MPFFLCNHLCNMISVGWTAGGYIVEADENDRLVAKPYNVNEDFKQKAE